MRDIPTWLYRSVFVALLSLTVYSEKVCAGGEPATQTFQQWTARHREYQLAVQAAFNAVTLTGNTECVEAQTQLQINTCVGRRLTAAREQFAGFFRNLQGALEPAPGEAAGERRQLLSKSQEIWICYRDVMLQAVGAEWEGGSGRPAAVGRAEVELIRSRMRELDMAYETVLHQF